MKIRCFTVSLFAMLVCLAGTPVAAQQRGFEPPAQLHAVNPSMSLTAPTKDLTRNNWVKVVGVALERWCSSSRPGRYGAEC